MAFVQRYNIKEDSEIMQIFWQNRGNLLVESRYEQSGNGHLRKVYEVRGLEPNQKPRKRILKRLKSYEPIPLKLQKRCRAFLRGTSRQTDITGLSKIIFKK